MQDYNYVYHNCFEITLEIGVVKNPSNLLSQWVWNQNALLAFMEQAHKGVKGFVTNEEGEAISGATISVKGINKNVTTDIHGDYYRLLTPGIYQLTAHMDGYESRTQEVEVFPNAQATELNFTLSVSAPATRSAYPWNSPLSWLLYSLLFKHF